VITRDKLKGFKESEYIDAILRLTANDLRLRGYRAQKTQIENIVQYLETNSLTNNIEDSKDKSWDRLKTFLDDLHSYMEKLEVIENKIIALEKEEKERKGGTGIIDFINA